LEILAARNEDERLLQGWVVCIFADVVQGVDEEAGIGQVGAIVRGAVANAAPLDVRLVDAFAFVPLEAFYVGFRALDDVIVFAVLVGFVEALNREACVVFAVLAAGDVDAAVFLDLGFHVLERL